MLVHNIPFGVIKDIIVMQSRLVGLPKITNVHGFGVLNQHVFCDLGDVIDAQAIGASGDLIILYCCDVFS